MAVCRLKLRHIVATDYIVEVSTHFKNDYFEKAISFQNSPNDLKKIKLNLRNKVLSSPLFDTESFTKDFTEMLKEVYSKHVSVYKD